MPLPQVIVRRGDRGAAPFPADDVSSRFEVVVAGRGPVDEAVECRSFSQVRRIFGEHTTTSTLRAVESYFAEGGDRAVLARVVGPDAVNASAILRDGAEATALTVTAVAPGDGYHAVSVIVEAPETGTERTVTVTLNGTPVVRRVVTSLDGAIELIGSSGYATAVRGAGTWPLRATTGVALAGGDDDIDSVSDFLRVSENRAEFLAALDRFDADLGPGSICASGWSDAEAFKALADHAAANNRFARGDLGADLDIGDMTDLAGTMRAHVNARHIQLLAGWVDVSVAGVSIPVAPSGVHTGREAVADRENPAGPGQPAAWSFGAYRTPVGVTRAFTRAQREELNDAGITVVTQDPQGAIYAEDAITLVDAARFPQYAEVSAMRVTMAIHAQAKQVLRQRIMQTIDGQGRVVAAARGDLVAICAGWYTREALYGDDAAEAYAVSVSAETETGRRPRLVGYLALRPSPSAHTVELTITQVAPGDTI